MADSKKNILIVEDQEDLRDVLGRLVRAEGFEAIFASDGRAAQQVLELEKVDLVLSDIRLPHLSGIDLLHYVKKTCPKPVVLMTGFSELLEAQEAMEIGADGFLAKPFKRDDLISILKQCCKGEEASKAEEPTPRLPSSEEEYCKLSIDDFISGREIQYDVYIRLADEKYVKIANRGDHIDMERVKAYKARNVQYLHMRKEDFGKYVNFNLSLVKAATSTSRVSRDKKAKLLKHTGEVLMESVFLKGVDKDAYDQSKSFVEASVEILTDYNDVFQILSSLGSGNDYVYVNAVGVSMYGVIVARALGWSSASNLFKISMGGLLHDVGKKEIDHAILAKPRVELTPAEIKVLESHPRRGIEILSRVKSVSGEVIQIVGQHHEDCIGTGYPLGLNREQIHPLARLISVVDHFCRLTLRTNDGEGSPPEDALRSMLDFYSDRLDPIFFSALMKVFNFTPPKEFSDPQKWLYSQKSLRGARGN